MAPSISLPLSRSSHAAGSAPLRIERFSASPARSHRLSDAASPGRRTRHRPQRRRTSRTAWSSGLNGRPFWQAEAADGLLTLEVGGVGDWDWRSPCGPVQRVQRLTHQPVMRKTTGHDPCWRTIFHQLWVLDDQLEQPESHLKEIGSHLQLAIPESVAKQIPRCSCPVDFDKPRTSVHQQKDSKRFCICHLRRWTSSFRRLPLPSLPCSSICAGGPATCTRVPSGCGASSFNSLEAKMGTAIMNCNSPIARMLFVCIGCSCSFQFYK